MQDAQIKYFRIDKQEWNKVLLSILNDTTIYAPFQKNSAIDYAIVDSSNIESIIYNIPKPVSPLKLFFSPVKQNVVTDDNNKRRIIMGIPACDLAALELLDAVYLEANIEDLKYKTNRDNTLLIGADCYSYQENCHCVTYGINPYPENNCDIVLSEIDSNIFISIKSNKGEQFIKNTAVLNELTQSDQSDTEPIKLKRLYIKDELNKKYKNLPGNEESKQLIKNSETWLWKNHSSKCVSCGACAAICPTCTCFLLIDRPEFEKIRQLDTCQYPGFEKIAAGEDPLKELSTRFKNRYLCKYVWKPERYKKIACTGCGRCIEACIGKINKNEVIKELVTG